MPLTPDRNRVGFEKKNVLSCSGKKTCFFVVFFVEEKETNNTKKHFFPTRNFWGAIKPGAEGAPRKKKPVFERAGFSQDEEEVTSLVDVARDAAASSECSQSQKEAPHTVTRFNLPFSAGGRAPIQVPASSATSDSLRSVSIIRSALNSDEVPVSLARRATLNDLQDMLWREYQLRPQTYTLRPSLPPLYSLSCFRFLSACSCLVSSLK